MKLTEIQLGDLVVDPKNARTHSKRNLETIGNSLRQFGQVENIVVQAGTNKVIGGNGRVEAMRAAGSSTVLANVIECTDAQASKMALALNRTAQLAGWDKNVLAESVGDLVGDGIDVSDIGFNDAELADLVGAPDIILEDRDDDIVDPDGAEAVTKIGDIWQLGDHRVMCGDSTSANHVNGLMQGRDAFIMVTDPPYGVNLDTSWRQKVKPSEGRKVGSVLNDDRCSWQDAYDQFRGDVAYVWHGPFNTPVFFTDLVNSGLRVRHVLIWNKERQVMSRGNYHPKFEPCLYAVRASKSAQWCGGRRQCDVWEIAGRGGAGEEGVDARTDHVTQKPIECMATPMRNHGVKGALAYDPFLGSGTSIIAAERTERICYGLELTPKYADVTVERWQNLTGGKAVKVTHG